LKTDWATPSMQTLDALSRTGTRFAYATFWTVRCGNQGTSYMVTYIHACMHIVTTAHRYISCSGNAWARLFGWGDTHTHTHTHTDDPVWLLALAVRGRSFVGSPAVLLSVRPVHMQETFQRGQLQVHPHPSILDQGNLPQVY
jgi:hypothetical protein